MRTAIVSLLLAFLRISVGQDKTCSDDEVNTCLGIFDFSDDIIVHPFSFGKADRDELCGDYNEYEGCVVLIRHLCPTHHSRRIIGVERAMEHICSNTKGSRSTWETEFNCVHQLAESGLETACSNPYHERLVELGAKKGYFREIDPSNTGLYTDLCSARLQFQRCSREYAKKHCDDISGDLLFNYTRRISMGTFDTTHCPGESLITGPTTPKSTVRTSRLAGQSVPPHHTSPMSNDWNPTGPPQRPVGGEKHGEGAPEKKGKNSVGIGLGIFAAIIAIGAAGVLLFAYMRSKRRQSAEGKNIMASETASAYSYNA